MPMNEYGEIIRNSAPPPPIPPFNNNNNNNGHNNNGLIIGIIIGIIIAVFSILVILFVFHKSSNYNQKKSNDNQELSYSANVTQQTTIPINNINETTVNNNTSVAETNSEENDKKQYPNGYVITQKDPLNIRESSNISSKIIGSIPKGTEIKIISESGDWYEVDYGGKIGYVSKTYISFDKSDIPQDEVSPNSEIKHGKVNTEKDPLNVRKQPSTDSKILGTVPKGSTITITGESGEWYTINFGNETGYVAKKYILISD